MKKTIQFLFAMSILMEGQNSFAGTNEITTNPDKPLVNAPLASPIRTPLYLIVTVLDEKDQPVSGATVSAPCTGDNPVLTNENGIAEFALPGNCNCNGAPAIINTSTCNTKITLSCTGSNEAICE